MRTILITAAMMGLVMPGIPASAQQNILDTYIDSAFRNNIVLQQKQVSLEKATYALDIAKGFYLPTVSFQAGYQTASGGRDIFLPLGDLLNEAYSSLNQLTQSSKFPQLSNERINFLPENFYDAKLRTTVPILNKDIYYNKELSKQQIALNAYEVEIYKRELIKNIKTAYFNYSNAIQAIEIYQSSLQLANEGRRVNQKLLDNGKGLPAYVLRANSEIEQVEAQITLAEQQAANARMYFNFLLNRNPDAGIDTVFDTALALKDVSELLGDRQAPAGREELKMLNSLVTLNETVLKMNRSVYYPRLNGFLDLGSQAQNWKFDAQSRYYMVGLQLDVPIFSGFRNRNKIRQSGLDVKNAVLQLQQSTQQLALAEKTACNNLRASYKTLMSSRKQLEAAASYQRLIDRGYREGTNTFLESVDARNQLTQAQLLVSVNQNKVLIAAAAVERETASYPLTNN